MEVIDKEFIKSLVEKSKEQSIEGLLATMYFNELVDDLIEKRTKAAENVKAAIKDVKWTFICGVLTTIMALVFCPKFQYTSIMFWLNIVLCSSTWTAFKVLREKATKWFAIYSFLTEACDQTYGYIEELEKSA